MNSLDDLRATLDQHLAGVEDDERYARPAAVRGRIRDVRRRRVTTVAVAAVVVLLAAVSVAGVALQRDRSVQPAGVLDVDVPQVEVGGVAYQLKDVRALSAGRSTTLTDGSPPVHGRGPALSLIATGLGDGRATLTADGEPLTALVGDETLSAPVTTVAGLLGAAQADLDGAPSDAQLGVAVYLPAVGDPGSATSIFPAETGGRVLLDAAVARSGDDGAQVMVIGPTDALTLDTYCRTDLRHVSVELEIDGESHGGGACDKNEGHSQSGDITLSPGRHVVRAVLTRGADGGTVVQVDSGTTLGIATYRWTARRDVLGTPVPETVDSNGRRWTLDQVIGADAGGEVRTSIDTGDEDVLLGLVTRGSTTISWQGDLIDEEQYPFEWPNTITQDETPVAVLLAGDTYQVTANSEQKGGDRVVLVYRPE